MKRWVVAVAVLALVLSGCDMRIDTLLSINEDESGEVVVFVGLDDELRELVEQFDTEGFDLVEEFSSSMEGWDVVEATMDKWQGARISTSFDSFDELKATLASLEDESADGSGLGMLDGVNIERDGRTLRFSAELDNVSDQLVASDSSGDLASLGLDDPALLNDLIVASVRVELPGEIGEHNADTVDGNELFWAIDFEVDSLRLAAESEVSGIGALVGVLESVVILTDLSEDESGTLTIDLQGDVSSDALAGALDDVEDWEVLDPGSSDSVQIQTTFDSDRNLERRLEDLAEQSAVGELANIFDDIDFKRDGDQMLVDYELVDFAPALADALDEDLELTVQLAAPGGTADTNADDESDDVLAWQVSAHDAGDSYRAVMDLGSFPIAAVVLLGLVAAAAVAGFVVVRRRGGGSETMASDVASDGR